MAYKLVCYDGRPVMKLSTGKVSFPGAKQVFRLYDSGGHFARDVIGLQEESIVGGTPLLAPVMAEGRRTGAEPALEEVRDRFREDFGRLDERFKALRNPPIYPVEVSAGLERLTGQVREELGYG
jgi:nicotinate phosphoribosyltransferase